MSAMPGYVKPGQEACCLDDAFWAAAERRARRLAKRHCVAILSSVLRDDEACFDLAYRLRRDMVDANPFDALRLLRASIGALHIRAGTHVVDGNRGDWPRVSTEPPADATRRRAIRLLSMVHELHKAGYQLLRVACGWDPAGHQWRARLMPAASVSEDGWSPVSGSWRADYSSDQGKNFFGWNDTGSDNARALANKFLERFPALLGRCVGQDWPYAGWFTLTLGRAEHGELPAFYGGGILSEDSRLPPPPLGISKDAESGFVSTTGQPLVPNDELTLEHLPPRGARYYDQILPFCISYDGYRGGLVSIDDCLAVAAKVEGGGLARASMDGLRTTAFIYQRKLKDQSKPIEEGDPPLKAIRAVIEEIRSRLG